MSMRHIYGQAAKRPGQYGDLQRALTSGESQYVKCNGKFWAYGKSTGGAPVFVRRLADVGRQPKDAKYVSTHKGRLTDFDFHPFIENIIATSSDDCKVNINQFPIDGLTEHVTKASGYMSGHKKKVSLIKFHPAANNVIASASYDRTVKIWNIETSACLGTMSECGDNIYSMDWNKDGSMLGVTGKDKILRVYDPRQQDSVLEIEAFGGIKSSKCFWSHALGFIGATGFSKGAKRELKLWDIRGDVKEPIFNKGLDNASSVLIPHMDNDLNMLYLAGKGDNSLSYYELKNDSKIAHFLSSYRDGTPQKGGAWVPRRGLEVMKCEVQRFLKLTKDSVVPISFIVPRKSGSDVFQDDIYPDCVSLEPAQTADQWASGGNAVPCTMSMDPEQRPQEEDGGVGIPMPQFARKATYDEVASENALLKNLNKQLQEDQQQSQEAIERLSVASGGSGGIQNDDVIAISKENEELKEAVELLQNEVERLSQDSSSGREALIENEQLKEYVAQLQAELEESKETIARLSMVDVDAAGAMEDIQAEEAPDDIELVEPVADYEAVEAVEAVEDYEVEKGGDFEVEPVADFEVEPVADFKVEAVADFEVEAVADFDPEAVGDVEAVEPVDAIGDYAVDAEIGGDDPADGGLSLPPPIDDEPGEEIAVEYEPEVAVYDFDQAADGANELPPPPMDNEEQEDGQAEEYMDQI